MPWSPVNNNWRYDAPTLRTHAFYARNCSLPLAFSRYLDPRYALSSAHIFSLFETIWTKETTTIYFVNSKWNRERIHHRSKFYHHHHHHLCISRYTDIRMRVSITVLPRSFPRSPLRFPVFSLHRESPRRAQAGLNTHTTLLLLRAGFALTKESQYLSQTSSPLLN